MHASPAAEMALPCGAHIGAGFAQAQAEAPFLQAEGRGWWIALGISTAMSLLLVASIGALAIQGVGVWGNNIPVTWALDIVSYDWWIGIACGGLLIASVASLWEGAGLAPVRRQAAIISLGAAVAAGLYPIIHLGRPWLFYWNLPYPNTLLLWPQFRSPLVWDAFDILGFLVVASAGLYVGMLPDLAMLRDRAWRRLDVGRGSRLKAQAYGIAALGWRGSAAHWQRHGQTVQVLGALGLIMVVTLQSGAAIMFTKTLEPGWDDPLLPVTFLTDAAWQGVAVCGLAAASMRQLLGLQAVILERELARLAWLLLVLGILAALLFSVGIAEMALSGDAFQKGVATRRFLGPHAWSTWSLIICAFLPVHVFWWRAARRSSASLAGVALAVCFGVFADHFMVIVISLQHDFLPSMAHPYSVGGWEVATFLGTSGLFVTLLLVAVRYVPVLSLGDLLRAEMPAARGTDGN